VIQVEKDAVQFSQLAVEEEEACRSRRQRNISNNFKI
jgi:hypothetical protein